MHYTLPEIEIPAELARALRERAAAERKSLDAAIVDALARGLGVAPQKPVKKRDLSFLAKGPPLEPEVLRALQEQRRIDLSDIAGTWESDPETEAIIEEQNRIDPEMWK